MSSSVMVVEPNVYSRTGSPGDSREMRKTMIEIPISVGMA
jgi:hypothetical protein